MHLIRSIVSDALHRFSHAIDPHKLRSKVTVNGEEVVGRCGLCGREVPPR